MLLIDLWMLSSEAVSCSSKILLLIPMGIIVENRIHYSYIQAERRRVGNFKCAEHFLDAGGRLVLHG